MPAIKLEKIGKNKTVATFNFKKGFYAMTAGYFDGKLAYYDGKKMTVISCDKKDYKPEDFSFIKDSNNKKFSDIVVKTIQKQKDKIQGEIAKYEHDLDNKWKSVTMSPDLGGINVSGAGEDGFPLENQVRDLNLEKFIVTLKSYVTCYDQWISMLGSEYGSPKRV